jgi:hypothetical protein
VYKQRAVASESAAPTEKHHDRPTDNPRDPSATSSDNIAGDKQAQPFIRGLLAQWIRLENV